MTYAPKSISELAALWVAKGGQPLGIVGDAAHRARPSYHNGKDAIEEHGRTRQTDYSIALDRDWRGLTDAAAAIDLGRLEGSLTKLQDFSRWLVARAKAGASGTEQIREIIYSPDGKVVRRWDGVTRREYDGYPAATGQGDSSHLWHTHISFYRDTESQPKTPIFLPYWENTEVEMYPIVTRTAFRQPLRFHIRAGTTLNGYDPAQPGRIVRQATWPADSSATAVARVGVEWRNVPAGQQAPVPRGYPFLEVKDGFYEGLLIVERYVQLDPEPDPCQPWRDWLEKAPR